MLIPGLAVAFICSFKYARPVKGTNENDDTDHYRCVSDVEGRPVEVAPQTEVDEVSDVTKTEAVYEIAYSATQNKTYGHHVQGSSWG